MKFRKSKIPLWILVIGCICIISALVIYKLGQKFVPNKYYEQQVAAAQLMHRCIDSLRTAFFQLPDKNNEQLDPNHTNLIGIEYSPITTTLGNIRAKRTSTNPDFAALFVKWFREFEVKSGDFVAVGCSGSFPALILATICAAEIINIHPIIIPSLGASSYGANRPGFTYLDIEKYLYQNDLIHHRSKAASLGGIKDAAIDLNPEGKKLLLEAIRRNDIKLINQIDLEQNVQIRAKIYEQYGYPKIFVNIGGAQINIGDYESEKSLAPGINCINPISNKKPQSMVEYFSNKRIPFIHILEIEQIAKQYNLPIDPIPLPEPGHSYVYFNVRLSPVILIISICLVLFGLIWIIWGKISFSLSCL